jgi:hypothetical protein
MEVLARGRLSPGAAPDASPYPKPIGPTMLPDSPNNSHSLAPGTRRWQLP